MPPVWLRCWFRIFGWPWNPPPTGTERDAIIERIDRVNADRQRR